MELEQEELVSGFEEEEHDPTHECVKASYDPGTQQTLDLEHQSKIQDW